MPKQKSFNDTALPFEILNNTQDIQNNQHSASLGDDSEGKEIRALLRKSQGKLVVGP